MSFDRRTFLALAGSSAAVAAAGCNGIVGRSSAQVDWDLTVEDVEATVGSDGIDDIVLNGDATGAYDNMDQPVDSVQTTLTLSVEGESKGAFYEATEQVENKGYLQPDGGSTDHVLTGTSLLDETQATASDFEPADGETTKETSIGMEATFSLHAEDGSQIDSAANSDTATITVHVDDGGGGEAYAEVGGYIDPEVQG